MENVFSKTILQVYKYLPRIARTYDRLVESKAINSQYTNAYNISYFGTEAVTKAIIDLSERKVTLINLKLLIERALKSMKPSMARILILKFVDGKRCVDLAEYFNVCLRTVFRKLNSALASFSLALKRLGYDESKLKEMLKHEKWISSVHNHFSKSDLSLIENDEVKSTIKSSIICDLKVSAM